MPDRRQLLHRYPRHLVPADHANTSPSRRMTVDPALYERILAGKVLIEELQVSV